MREPTTMEPNPLCYLAHATSRSDLAVGHCCTFAGCRLPHLPRSSSHESTRASLRASVTSLLVSTRYSGFPCTATVSSPRCPQLTTILWSPFNCCQSCTQARSDHPWSLVAPPWSMYYSPGVHRSFHCDRSELFLSLLLYLDASVDYLRLDISSILSTRTRIYHRNYDITC